MKIFIFLLDFFLKNKIIKKKRIKENIAIIYIMMYRTPSIEPTVHTTHVFGANIKILTTRKNNKLHSIRWAGSLIITECCVVEYISFYKNQINGIYENTKSDYTIVE